MDDLLIVSKNNNEFFTSCKPDKVQAEIEHAKEFYTRDLKTYKEHLINWPKMAEHWNSQIKYTSDILAAGFEAVTWEEYQKREANKWLSKTATECTEEEYNRQLNVLPPLNYINIGSYTIFHVGECTTMTYYPQYIHIHGTNKYYCATTDLYDRATWIDKLLGLRK